MTFWSRSGNYLLLKNTSINCSPLLRLPVPVHVKQKEKVSRISLLAKFVLLTWAVFGGLFLYFFLANFITVLLRPKYEQPIDSAQEVLDRGMIPFGMGSIKIVLLTSPNPVYQQLGKKYLDFPGQYGIDKILKEEVLGKNTHVLIGMLYNQQKKFGKFHYSKEHLQGAGSYSVNIMNKKWEYADAFNHHLLLIYQV